MGTGTGDPKIEPAMPTAVEHFRAGRLAEAETICRQILRTQPSHPDALHLLGLVAARTGHNDAAVDLFGKAIALKPAAEYYVDLGMIWVAGRSMEAATTAFREAVRVKPDHVGALNNLAIALGATGRNDEAIETCRRGLRLAPGSATLHNNLGKILVDVGRAAEAIDELGRALQCRPDYAEAWNNLGNAFKGVGRLDEAFKAYQRAIEIKPSLPEAHNNASIVLFEQGRFAEAVGASQNAISARPGYAQAYNNLGNALKESDRVSEAIAAYQEGIRLAPYSSETHCNMAVTLAENGFISEAMAAYDQALSLDPDSPQTRATRATLLLLLGDFQQGWREYQYRWRIRDFLAGRQVPEPIWKGEDLQGRRLLLCPEQGTGDTIQFIRYATLAAGRGARVMLQCPPELSRLLRCMPEVEQVSADATREGDLHCPLLDLPLAFRTDANSIPAKIPYLFADPIMAADWAHRMGPARPAGKPVRVGLAWAGRPTHKNDRRRSISLAQLAPLAGARDAIFYSLQKGPSAAQSAAPPAGMHLADFSADLYDFADTAALISNLDLVISVDTSVAHLAGAMGKPTWVLLPFVPDWRWMLDREDTPWYPTMRLFRQKTAGDWATVIERMGGLLGNEEGDIHQF